MYNKIIMSFSAMSYSKKSTWNTFCSITKVKRCLCVLKQVLVVNLYNINIQDTIIKGGFQTLSYIKDFPSSNSSQITRLCFF